MQPEWIPEFQYSEFQGKKFDLGRFFVFERLYLGEKIAVSKSHCGGWSLEETDEWPAGCYEGECYAVYHALTEIKRGPTPEFPLEKIFNETYEHDLMRNYSLYVLENYNVKICWYYPSINKTSVLVGPLTRYVDTGWEIPRETDDYKSNKNGFKEVIKLCPNQIPVVI